MKEKVRPLHIDEDLHAMLTFYHDLGRIIYFGNLSEGKTALTDMVILDPQWLVNVFKQVITISDAGELQDIVRKITVVCKKKYRRKKVLMNHNWVTQIL